MTLLIYLAIFLLWLNVGCKFIRRLEKKQILTGNLWVAHTLDGYGWPMWWVITPIVLVVWLMEGFLWPLVGLWLLRFGRRIPTHQQFLIVMRPKGKQLVN